MKAVVYESLWGNTAAVARVIAAGIGPCARCLSTSKATPEALADLDLLVAGGPVFGFRLPTGGMRRQILVDLQHRERPPDLSAPSLREWLDRMPRVALARMAGSPAGEPARPAGDP
jgi:hypothetical protein